MSVPSFTHLNKPIDPADTPKGFNTNNNTFVQETSVFYGGQIYCNFGAFVQGTYERPGSSYFLDNTDIRYANKTKLGGTEIDLRRYREQQPHRSRSVEYDAGLVVSLRGSV